MKTHSRLGVPSAGYRGKEVFCVRDQLEGEATSLFLLMFRSLSALIFPGIVQDENVITESFLVNFLVSFEHA